MKRIPLLMAPLLACQFAFAEEETSRSDETRNWKITAGGGMASTPRYEGSATNRIRFVPLLDLEYGRFFAGTSRGLGYNLSDTQNIQYGPRLTLAQRRWQNADARLNGMTDLGYAAEAGAYGHARFGAWYLDSSLAASSRGTRVEFGGGYDLPLTQADKLRFGVDATWGNTKYMQTYFGVSAAEATASGGVLNAYNAGSGIKDYQLKANWTHAYNAQWFSNAGIAYKRLAGSALNSPLTMRRSATTASFVVGYRF